MSAFTIAEDFPESEIQFDQRFSDETECYSHLFQTKWPAGFRCTRCEHKAYWVGAKHFFICTNCER